MFKSIGALLLLAGVACAATPTSWEMNTYQDFLKGKLKGLALEKEGRLLLGSRLEEVFRPGESAIWSMVTAPDGTLYVGTGHKGRVFAVSPAGQGKVLWTGDRSEIFALALDAKGVLYAATSPSGKVWRIERDGKASEYFDPKARYIWTLHAAADGALYVGTGEEGKVFRVTAPGQGTLFAETGQAHITALTTDTQGRVLIGTEPNGILYRAEAGSNGKARLFALLDSDMTEVRRIVARPDGSLYVALMGGTTQSRTQQVPATQPTQPAGDTPDITITVTDAASAAVDPKPAASSTAPAAAPTATPAVSSVVSYNVEKSAILRIAPDLTQRTLWSSQEENAMDLALLDNALLFGTDVNARIYRLDPSGAVSLVTSNEGEEIVRFGDGDAGRRPVATSLPGVIYRLGAGTTGNVAAEYESPVHDAASVVRWGRLAATASGRIAFQTRTGNSSRPDASWSDWSAEGVPDASGSVRVASPNARFLQWRAVWKESAALLDGVTVNYQAQNRAPVLKTITATATYAASASTKPTAASASAAATATATFSVTVTDTGETANSTPAGTPSQTMVRQTVPQIFVAWVGEDADGDKLRYDVEYRHASDREWKSLKKATTDTSVMLDSEQLGEGRFLFRVRVTDELSNGSRDSLTGELTSPPVLIDLSAPRLATPVLEKANRDLRASVTVTDALSPVRRCELSVDGGTWQTIPAEDGVADSLQEVFSVLLPLPGPGEHAMVVRCFDAAENTGLIRILVP